MTYQAVAHGSVREHEKLLNAQWENLLVLNDWMGLFFQALNITRYYHYCSYQFHVHFHLFMVNSELAFLFGSHMLLLCNTLDPAPTAIHVRYAFWPQRQ